MTDGTVVPVRVMMVDDDPFILTVFAEQLDAQPSVSVCATAAGGGQALKTLSSRSHCIDVVLLDISMPDLDGIQTARAIHKQYPEIPLVVFTAFSRDDMLAEALAEGVNGFITKDESAEDVATAMVRKDVHACLLEGLTNRRIAKRLSISENTARIYVSDALHRLGYASRTELIAAALGN